jgi:hypothetical protein
LFGLLRNYASIIAYNHFKYEENKRYPYYK